MRPPDHNRRRVARLLAGCGAVGVLLGGCQPNKRYDLIEAELRTRDRELQETRAALEQARLFNRAYEQQQRVAPAAGPVAVPAGALSVKDIQLARGTGGLDEDGLPGDEALMAVVVPRDEDGSAVKVPARMQVLAFEVTPQGLKNPIGNWDIPADRLRSTWRSGILSTGYFITVPWQTFPTTERVRVAVRLTTTDGRAFEADRDVSVRPVPQAVPRGLVPGLPVPPASVLPPIGLIGPTPVPVPKRETLVPDPLPPGVEELPPPARSERGVRLLPPVPQ